MITNILWFLFIGAAAGWLAAQFFKDNSFDLVGNLTVGILGAFLGGFIFQQLGIHISGGFVGPAISATAGAVILLFLISLFNRLR